MAEQSAALAMAAAIAAAAELAKNGGSINMYDLANKQRQATAAAAAQSGLVSVSPEPQEHFTQKSIRRVQTHHSSNNLNDDDDNDDHSQTHTNNTANSIHSDDEEEDDEEDAEKRLARSRERNREHARRTRLRKKAQLDALQIKAKGLEEESIVLKQSIEECSIASILVGISSSNNKNNAQANKTVTDTLLDVSNFDKNNGSANGTSVSKRGSPKVVVLSGGKRKRFISEDAMERAPQPLKLNIDGQSTLIGGGKTHINWKSGVYCDENGVQRQLTQEQLESLRRERNRMHAKMTRDRKKGFIAAIEKTIEHLETNNKKMRAALTQVAKHHFGPNAITPQSSPLVTGMVGGMAPADIQDKMSSPALARRSFMDTMSPAALHKPTVNRVPHGFSLTAP